ncbi:MAG: hypothetical protein L0H53_09875 [Candidatus Nitrosocosmicus sp.]|nr:hypothetical protein [Candidatus Nitrosocosmicus sp.]MDN5867469.1 hypothetical protein [Candidatus Nitrosocosmicus sp.]
MTSWHFLLIYIFILKMAHPNGGSTNPGINTVDILEQNLIRLLDNSTNMYQAVENVTIMDYLEKSDG